MAEWYENSNNIRGIAKTMAEEFKRAKVGCCDDDGSGSSDGGKSPQERFNDAQDKSTEKLGILGTIITTLVSPFKKVKQALDAAFGDVMRRAAYDFEYAMRTSIDANKTWRSQLYAIKLGETAANIAELSAQTRQSVIAMGGMEEWTTKIGAAQRDYFGFIGNTADTTKYLAKQMQLFGEFGIKPSMEAMEDQTNIAGGTNKSLKQITVNMAKLGIPMEQQQELLRSTLEDEYTQARLRAANSSQERTNIVRNVMARQQEYIALGMSADGAMNASKALEAIGGKKPLDRYKQAAKATAALSAMGIEGAARVGEIIRMGQRASKADKDYVRARLGMAEDVYAESKTLGKGYEFTIAALYEKGGFADLMGEGGLFSTKIKETIKVMDGYLDSTAVLGERKDTEAEVLTSGMLAAQKFSNAMERTIPGLMAQKGGLGLAGLGLMEAAFQAMGDKGIISDKEMGDIKELMKGFEGGADEFAEAIGLSKSYDAIKNNAMVQGVGELKDTAVQWYKEWKTGSDEDKMEDLQDKNAASLEKIVKLTEQQNKTFSTMTQHQIETEAKKIKDRADQYAELQKITKASKSKTKMEDLKGT